MLHTTHIAENVLFTFAVSFGDVASIKLNVQTVAIVISDGNSGEYACPRWVKCHSHTNDLCVDCANAVLLLNYGWFSTIITTSDTFQFDWIDLWQAIARRSHPQMLYKKWSDLSSCVICEWHQPLFVSPFLYFKFFDFDLCEIQHRRESVLVPLFSFITILPTTVHWFAQYKPTTKILLPAFEIEIEIFIWFIYKLSAEIR